jgi:tyrosine-protein kinase Etk/Wzc
MSKTAPNTSVNDATQKDDEIDLIALLLTLLRGWKTIITCALLGLALGFTYSRYVQPTYQTDALIQIDKKSQGIAALGANISELVGAEATPAETERELIKSRMILEPVIKNLNLDILISDSELGTLDRIAQSSIPTQISTEKGVFLKTKNGAVQISNFEVPRAYENKTFTITKTTNGFDLTIELNDVVETYKGNIGSTSIIKTPEGDITMMVDSLPSVGHQIALTKLSKPSAINNLNSELTVSERGKQTGIVQLTLTGEDQEQVSRVLSNVVQSYVDQNLARGSEQTTTTIKFMESQIPQLKQKLEKSEEAFNKFREQYGPEFQAQNH